MTESFLQRHQKTFVLTAAALLGLVVVIVLVTLLSGGETANVSRRLDDIQSRLERLEKRVATMAFSHESLAQVVDKTERLDQFMNEYRKLEADFMLRLSKLESKLGIDPAQDRAPESQATAPEPEPEPKADAPAETVQAADSKEKPAPDKGPQAFYKVRQGDTIYSISRQHGLTPDRLKQINNLESNTIIPGQKLKISD